MNDLSISSLQSILPQLEPSSSEQTNAVSSTSFSSYVKQMLKDTNQQMLDADQAIENLTTGRNPDIHNTMIAMKKAEISFELVMQIRNKLISAYDEIRKMSI
ncbi:putative Flagellar hook-basal body complex protein FliE [Desulfosarcina cetonica]|uniref:flagellar hook-basal body complex protein FliE n=1 Tax=Desulfosarcina cetonica TaxID=90730 RepID=UPI0006D0AECA|nr:flagellar hook-basal body complex protein FliE [Desulfosarcina cetonica]VTR65277.1 putative Flagellar hook-basal body complex protein FliE [Desulfosarcina cetonica]